MSDLPVRDQLFRQRYRFSREGDVLRIDIWSEPGGGVLTEHFHPTIEERYEVLEGQLTVYVEGKPRVLGPGERAVVPPGVRHRFENTGERESHVLVKAEPAEQLRESIEEGAALGGREQFSPNGKPRSARALFAAAALAHRYRETVVPTSPPRPVQRILFPILARLDRSTTRSSR